MQLQYNGLCQSLFSQTGHAVHPNCNRTVAETFVRLVMGKHWLSRIYCSPGKVSVELFREVEEGCWE